jgi:biopolymer transport protein TolR
MAMDMGGAKGGVKSDINVTPLVDVMLVLLIIMMAIAPMLQKGVPVNLPEAVNAQPKPDTSDQTTVVHIDGQGQYYVNGVQCSLGDLPANVKKAFEDKKEKIVYLKGDKDAPYENIMKMMDALRGAQIENVALITERNGGNVTKKGGN